MLVIVTLPRQGLQLFRRSVNIEDVRTVSVEDSRLVIGLVGTTQRVFPAGSWMDFTVFPDMED